MKKCLVLVLAVILLLPSAALTEELFEDHFFLQNMNRSSCRTLTGEITLYVIFAETPNASWDQASRKSALTTLDQACILLEQAASAYKKHLSLTYSCHAAPSLPPVDEDDLEIWVDLALERAGLPARGGDSPYMQQHSPILVLFNEGGVNFAMANGDDDFCEYLFLHKGFVKSSVVHELMHLYGARDLYYPQSCKKIAEDIFPASVMLTYNSTAIDRLTAYCIGWQDSLADSAINFLKSTAHVTEEEFDEALEQVTFTGHASREYTNYTYTGDFVMGQLQGYGVQEWENGLRYSGEFFQGKRQGQGVMVYSNDEIFKGNFNENAPDGYGIQIWNDLGIYAGNWETGTASGKGTVIFNDGFIRSGTMEKYILQGTGVEIRPEGSLYRGDFVGGSRTGKGTLIWPDGSLYTGDFVEGALTGHGIYIDAEGNIFEGQWFNGMLQE